jgi:hypothetical protein
VEVELALRLMAVLVALEALAAEEIMQVMQSPTLVGEVEEEIIRLYKVVLVVPVL